MSFKSSVIADAKNIFLNTSEFADTHTVKYDGDVYSSIPVLLTQVKEKERTILANDYMQGIHLVTAVAHIAQADLDGVIPEQKRTIEIDDGTALGSTFYRKYRIVTSDCEMGMITLELEAYDE